MGDLNGNIVYEAEREAEMETWMDNLQEQAIHEVNELMRKLQELPDIRKDDDALGKAVTYICGTYDGLKKISSVMGFLDAVLETGECPQLKPIDELGDFKNFAPAEGDEDDAE